MATQHPNNDQLIATRTGWILVALSYLLPALLGAAIAAWK